MTSFEKRTLGVYSVLILALAASVLWVYSAAMKPSFAAAARDGATFTLSLPARRGLILDRNGIPLAGAPDGFLAAVSNEPEAISALREILPDDEFEALLPRLGQGKPFLLPLGEFVSAKGLTLFPRFSRTPENEPVSHLVGLTGADNAGLTGLERAYDEFLRGNEPETTVTFEVNAAGERLAGKTEKIEGAGETLPQWGVVTTLDRRVQRIVREAAARYLGAGAIVVVRVPDGQVAAAVSVPDFTPEEYAGLLFSDGGALNDRCLSSYNVGSSFKLLVAAAALEAGIPEDFSVECTGAVEIDGVRIPCYHDTAHGMMTMESALAASCNCYFIRLARQVGGEKIRALAEQMGFSRALALCPGVTTAAASLPEERSLSLPAALANFSIGQGGLLASPVHLAAMVNCIASDGYYTDPSLVISLREESGEEQALAAAAPRQVISVQTAKVLRKMMAAPLTDGTAAAAMPEKGGAGGKTATAQTGMFIDGERVNQSWFVGYFPYDEPQYAVAVLAENTTRGSLTTNPAFKAIADALNE